MARRSSSGGGEWRAGIGESRDGGGESRDGIGEALGLLRGGLNTLLIAWARGDAAGELEVGELADGELAGDGAVGRLRRASISS